MDDRHVSEYVNSRMRSKQTRYNNKIFSKSRGTWMHDLLINNGATRQMAQVFHVFINVNTRYGEVIAMNSKKVDDVVLSLKVFIGRRYCKKLISDAEPAFTSKAVLDMLEKKGIDVQINDEQNHKTLGIIDRFIRTIRDAHGSNKPMLISWVYEWIKKYNDTVHSATGLKPSDMERDKKLEVRYIISMLHKQSDIENGPGYKLDVGDYVRLIKEERTMKKKRRRLTKHYYTVDSTDLNRIVIMAADGSTKTVSRSDVVKIRKDTGLTQAKSIGEGKRGTVKRIIRYNPKKDTYRVEFDNGDGTPYYDTIPVRNMRAQFPNRKTDMEIEYFQSKR